jgi:hypothetical protein
VSADLRGADGAFEDAGNLGEGEFLETGEEQDFAILAVEAGESGVQKSVVVAGGGTLSGVGRVVGVVLEIDGVGGVRGGVGLAEVVRGAAAGEVVHPGGEAAVVAVGVAVLEHALEDNLRDVLGGGTVPGQLDQKPEEGPVMAFEEFAERVEFAVADGKHEGVIGALFGGGVHGRGGAAVSDGLRGRNADFFEYGNHGGSGT